MAQIGKYGIKALTNAINIFTNYNNKYPLWTELSELTLAELNEIRKCQINNEILGE